MCLRHCVYHNTFLHLLPSMGDFMSDFTRKNLILNYHIVCLSCPYHVNEFSTVLTGYDTIYIFCFRKNVFYINFVL